MAAAFAKIATGLGVLGLGAFGAYRSLYTVEGGYKAVVFNKLTGTYQVCDMGTHFLIPWVEEPYLFDVRRRSTTRVANTGSKDLQMVKVTLRILHMPIVTELQQIVQELGKDYAERVLSGIAPEVLGGTVAEYTAAQLITERSLVSAAIRNKLTYRSTEFHLFLDDVSITHVDFAPEYTAAVEAKQVAQQQSERAKFTVEKAIQVKEEIIIKAEAEARAARDFNSQLAADRSGNFLALRRLQAAQDIAEILVQGGNRIYLSADSLLFNVLDKSHHQAHGRMADSP